MPNIVKFPKPGRAGFNPNRPLEKNALIQSQVQHFHHVEQGLPKDLQTGVDIGTVRTEGQAAKYIAKVTKALHNRGPAPAPKVETAR